MTSVRSFQSAGVVLQLPVMLAIRRALFHFRGTERHKAPGYSAAVDQKWLAMAFGMPEANLSSCSMA
ncbi:hypothetical protein [Bradyrhizobium sp. TM233]|uniref:hypothetical protein n=1 Tax=Bradyrhizobium sp. TM233 TaxID=2599801 RepID=UPI0030C73DC9